MNGASDLSRFAPRSVTPKPLLVPNVKHNNVFHYESECITLHKNLLPGPWEPDNRL